MHDLLSEAGDFLVSVKMIFMAYKNNVFNKEISKELQAIKNISFNCLIKEIKKGK